MFVKFCQKVGFVLNKAQAHDPHGRKLRRISWVHFPTVLLTSLFVTGALVGLKSIGRLQSLELAAFDQMVRLHSQQAIDPRLLVVEITEQDIQNQKRWPLSDEVIAQALQQLQQHQPKVIGLDLYRDVFQPPGTEQLSKQLQADNLIAVTHYGFVPPPQGVPPERIGLIDLLSDPDNVIRRNLLYARVNSEELYSFGLRLSLHYLADQNLAFQVKPDSLNIGNTVFEKLQANSGGYQLPDSEAKGWQILLRYRSEPIAREVTLTEVLNGEIDPAWVQDKIVLIGTTAPSIKDIFPTPYSSAKTQDYLMAGVVLHAQMVSQILSSVLDDQPLFWFWNQSIEGLWIWVWSLGGGILVWRLHHPLKLGLSVTFTIGGLWSICFLTFTQAGWIPFFAPTIGVILSSGIVLAYKVLYSISYDPLTGLPNRTQLTKHIRKLNQKQNLQHSLFAVLFLDLDRFRIINQGLGHHIGDQLIICASKRVKTCLPSQGLLARVGGDEFAILLPAVQEVHEVNQLAQNLQKKLMKPFYLEEQEIYTTVSIGIAYNQTGNEMLADDPLRDAQTAMYQAKALGKARHQVFATGMHIKAKQRLEVETDLRQAIKNQEFQLYYQPIICLKKNSIIGFEALIRWQSPKRGFVSPDQFIPVAEETGLIIPLGQWIIEAACKQLCILHEKFPQNSPLTVSINLSSRQFSQPDLVENIEQIITDSGLDFECVKLEITESAIMDDVEEAIAILSRLKALGLQLSIDDFGIGYSSLSYLHRFPVNTLKIDRSFVNRIEQVRVNAEIVKAIVVLAHNLGLNVVAEGIETEEQKRTLQALNCEYGQGYFFSKPLAHEAAADLLSKELIEL